MASHASHMLEAALEKMDDIIAGKILMESSSPGHQSSKDAQVPTDAPFVDLAFETARLTEALRAMLEDPENKEEKGKMRKQVSAESANVILKWLKNEENLRSNANSESYQERLLRLEGDKESLVLQVSVLTDQVEAQGLKINDLETSLVQHQHKLNNTEEMLQQELQHRTSLEKQKVNLMGEVSYLKLKLANMEGKQGHGSERQHKAETVVNFISELQEQMCQFQKEINSKIQEKKASKIPADSRLPVAHHTEPAEVSKNHEVAQDRSSEGSDEPEGNTRRPREGSSEQRCHCGEESILLKELRTLKDKVEHLEDQKSQYEKRLKATKAEISNLQQLVLSKNTEIESLHTQLLARPATASSERDQELQRLRSGMKSLLAANDEKDRRIDELTLLLNQCRQFREVNIISRQAPSAVCSLSNGRTPSSSSEEGEQNLTKNGDSVSAKSDDGKSEVSTNSLSSQHPSLLSIQKDGDSRTEPTTLSSSMNDIMNGHLQKSVPGDTRSQTLPACSSLSEQHGDSGSEIQSQKSPESSEDGDSGQRKLDRVDDSASSENSVQIQTGQRAVGSSEYIKNNRSFRKFWGRLRRTQSGGFQAADPEPGQFRRGGLRATAGPRLTRTPESDSACDMNIPFSQWTKEQVCNWLEDYGLGQHIGLSRQWIESGQTLLSASPQELEKEMGMKHPLHRKKLQLALKAFITKVVEKSSELDHIWVTRWLDDIGLPQYKDQFHEARVDGRMIQYLTVNDLLTLKVTSQLHHLSIKCAIHVLHANKFNPNCLRRRPGEENQPSPSEVVQWSNHRVMEWLRAVDLAEYAPNLRGSGVHGGLIILEPRFSSETLALLLNIPPQKTLLRRHLATAFATLVGAQATQEKREYGNATGHVPLTTTAKVKPKKLGFTQFSHLRKRKPDESTDYICPTESGVSSANGVTRFIPAAHRSLSPTLERQPEK